MKSKYYREFQASVMPGVLAHCRHLASSPLGPEVKARLLRDYRRGFLRICRETRSRIGAGSAA